MSAIAVIMRAVMATNSAELMTTTRPNGGHAQVAVDATMVAARRRAYAEHNGTSRSGRRDGPTAARRRRRRRQGDMNKHRQPCQRNFQVVHANVLPNGISMYPR